MMDWPIKPGGVRHPPSRFKNTPTGLVKTFDGRKTLRLGGLYGLREVVIPYQAIFPWDNGSDALEL